MGLNVQRSLLEGEMKEMWVGWKEGRRRGKIITGRGGNDDGDDSPAAVVVAATAMTTAAVVR